MVAVPQISTKLGAVKPGIVWKIRRAVYGLKRSPRLRQEERDRVLEELTWYSDHWKSLTYSVQSRMHPSMWLMIKGMNPLKDVKMAQP
eukprot:6502841-Prorocentrum_lima.AAC.1